MWIGQRSLLTVSLGLVRRLTVVDPSSCAGGRVRCVPSLTCVRGMTHYPIDDVAFGLTDEQRQLRETAFHFAQKELAPHAEAIDRDNHYPQLREFFRKCGEMGFLGITADPEFGGTGGTYLDHVIINEELS
ncbi:unnamed protein product, partial [Cyprideis torosa]